MCFCYFSLSILRSFVGSPLNSSGRIFSWVLPAVGAGCATCQAATMKKWEIRLDDIILMWQKQCHVYHPPVITIFKGVKWKNHSQSWVVYFTIVLPTSYLYKTWKMIFHEIIHLKNKYNMSVYIYTEHDRTIITITIKGKTYSLKCTD